MTKCASAMEPDKSEASGSKTCPPRLQELRRLPLMHVFMAEDG